MPKWLIYFCASCTGIILAGPAGLIVAVVIAWFVMHLTHYSPSTK